MAGKFTKREIATATRQVNEMLDLLEEIKISDGRHEANASAQFGPHARRMSNYISLLIRAEAPLPERLVKSWGWYRSCGWHSHETLPHYVTEAA